MQEQTALLIIDIQNDYFPGGANVVEGSPEAAAEAEKMLEYFRGNNMPVVHIRHESIRPGATFFIPGSEGAEIHESVAPAENEKVIVKNYPNGFHNTGLLDYLLLQNIQALVICGMMTNMCVDATVRAAKDFGFKCILISDACAAKELEFQEKRVSAEDVQTAFLSSLNYYYSRVMTAEEFLEEYS